MTVIYRPGTLRDITPIASYLYQATVGISHYLLDGLFEKNNVQEIIESVVADRDTNMYYKNTLVAEVDGTIEAVMTIYPTSMHVLPDVLYSYLSEEKIKTITPFFRELPVDGKYVYSMACNPQYTRLNLFKGLTMRCFIDGKREGFKAGYMHVLENNMKFLKFLSSHFEVIDKISITPQPEFNIPDTVYLLRYDVDVRKACWGRAGL
ncbi:MAG: hypothetical protein NTW08_09370 [Gammaproteobacteria bacterium]|nr:hypothetical protein [Gammaproteobacteria bacterium]